ncbi:unnamed protein product [Darwinula stevensoni]|uniref:Uncharacterized protein n=1 Tax=Darwinula stevensoni TaxID=69355 RepID=A0A7R9AE33_9CRUS|nr:unnamed protein product [Darwinula stevensoni]CAG0901956.1 unnamed protein product [Darwinula stevensoni]
MFRTVERRVTSKPGVSKNQGKAKQELQGKINVKDKKKNMARSEFISHEDEEEEEEESGEEEEEEQETQQKRKEREKVCLKKLVTSKPGVSKKQGKANQELQGKINVRDKKKNMARSEFISHEDEEEEEEESGEEEEEEQETQQKRRQREKVTSKPGVSKKQGKAKQELQGKINVKGKKKNMARSEFISHEDEEEEEEESGEEEEEEQETQQKRRQREKVTSKPGVSKNQGKAKQELQGKINVKDKKKNMARCEFISYEDEEEEEEESGEEEEEEQETQQKRRQREKVISKPGLRKKQGKAKQDSNWNVHGKDKKKNMARGEIISHEGEEQKEVSGDEQEEEEETEQERREREKERLKNRLIHELTLTQNLEVSRDCEIGHEINTDHNIQILQQYGIEKGNLELIKKLVQLDVAPDFCEEYNIKKCCSRGDESTQETDSEGLEELHKQEMQQ